MGSFYVYEHTSTATGKVFYVGKGCGSRAHMKSGRSAAWRDASANGFTVEIVLDCLSDIEARELERVRIQKHAGGLVNTRLVDTREYTTKNAIPMTLTLSPEIVGRLDAWLKKQEFPPAKNAVIEAALKAWLDGRND